MLPRSTHTRHERASLRSRPDTRAYEIQRLIGRSLRAAVDLDALGERTVILDCDVIQADGGTRVAAITGGYVALVDAVQCLIREHRLSASPVHGAVAAVSTGLYRGEAVLDLDYAEDTEAESDLNVVMNELGALIEIQGTAEGHALRREEFDRLRKLLTALAGLPSDRWTARFRCILVLWPAGRGSPFVAEGVCSGRILAAPRGTIPPR